LPDPRVPALCAETDALAERAIAFCQSTLSYGRAQEAAPDRRMIPIEPVVAEAAKPRLASTRRSPGSGAIERGLSIDADPDQLFRVLLNLVRNAAQALENRPRSDAATMQIRITGRREGAWRSSRFPTPAPASPQRPANICSRRSNQPAGPAAAGLGLAIAAELVRAHGGDIHLVEGTIGATFRIAIPDRPVELLSVRNERARPEIPLTRPLLSSFRGASNASEPGIQR